MKYEVAAIDLQNLVARAMLDLLDLVVDREIGDFVNGLLARRIALEFILTGKTNPGRPMFARPGMLLADEPLFSA